jgi:hypothetical protein
MIDKRQRKCFSSKRKSDDLIKEEENAISAVKFIRLFRFATRSDAILISASVMASIFNGLSVPFMTILWGDLSKAIIENYDSGANKMVIANTTTCQSSSNITQIGSLFT